MASPEDVAGLIRHYEAADYDELRTGIAQHHMTPDAFPEFLKGGNRIVATLGRDGVVVVHWRAEKNSFEFDNRPTLTVGDILKDQGIGELDYQPGERPAAFRMQGPHWIMNSGALRPITELDWKTVEVNPDTATWS